MTPLSLLLAPAGSVGRDEAQRRARQELSDPAYHRDDPSLLDRGVSWVWERIQDLLDRAADATPAGYLGLLGLAVVVVAVAAVLLRTVGPLRRAASAEEPLFTGAPLSAADHRARADAHAAAGEWAEAVRERVRAVIRDLEQRAVIDDRPGRTADEAAADAGRALPECRDSLVEMARTFDEVWYGGRQAGPLTDARLRRIDEQVRAARPALPVAMR